MQLIKEHWTKDDIKEFIEFEKTLKGTQKEIEFEQKIVLTKLPCYGKTSSKAKEIYKQIKKGNYLEFIQNMEITSHFDTILLDLLITNIKDFSEFKKQLLRLIKQYDNWASCDALSFKKRPYNKLLTLSNSLIKSKKTFVRRVGVLIHFELIKDAKYLDNAFKLLDSLSEEKEYYVNMCAAWLLCECFAKYRNETLAYFKSNKTNNFIINKAISKCVDSYRVSFEDKVLLKGMRQK